MSRVPLTPIARFLRRLAPSEGEASDGQLLARFVQTREEDAFARLVGRHGGMVFGVCRRVLADAHDAEDAFQATFLVLARKAASVRKCDSVASWLYGVAHRVALKARSAAAARRQAEQRQVVRMTPSDPVAEAAWRELRPLLDEELARLPEKYRAPVVLCYLEGKTNDEAARLLGWTKGTVSGRLARARDLLRGRLARRGLALSGASLATLVTANAASSAPAPLAATTAAAALAFAAGETITGASPGALTLAKEVVQVMLITRWTLVTVAVLALAGAGAGLLWSPAGAADEDKPAAAAQAQKAVEKKNGAIFDEARRAPDDQETLQGTWAVVEMEAKGEKAPDDAFSGTKVVIKGDRLTFALGTEARVSTFRLDPRKKPKVIALTPQDGPSKGQAVEGIYELDGDRLRLCFENGDGKATPTKFATRKDDEMRLLVLERREWGNKDPKIMRRPDGHRWKLRESSPVRAVAYAPDGKSVGVATDGLFLLLDAETGKVRRRSHLAIAVRGLAFAPDGRTVAVGGTANREETLQGGVIVFDAAKGLLLQSLDGATNALAFSPDGKRLATAGPGGVVTLWDPATGKRVATMQDKGLDPRSVAFSPDGKLIAAGGPCPVICLWDVATAEYANGILVGEKGVTAVAFSPDGKRLASAEPNGAVRLWDVASRKEVRTFKAGDKGIRAIAFGPGGATLLAGGEDGVVRSWDLATGNSSTINAHAKEVTGVAVSPDGVGMVTGSADGTVAAW